LFPPLFLSPALMPIPPSRFGVQVRSISEVTRAVALGNLVQGDAGTQDDRELDGCPIVHARKQGNSCIT